jgi:hypothetical protein
MTWATDIATEAPQEGIYQSLSSQPARQHCLTYGPITTPLPKPEQSFVFVKLILVQKKMPPSLFNFDVYKN